MLSILDRERTVAPPGYNRWLVPPAALAIHLSVGQAYAFSVFNTPLTKLLGITHSAPGDWNKVQIGWIFSLAIVCLGLSAAVFGKWMEAAGPRKAMLASALCFGSGFLVAALGLGLHLLPLVYLGYGVLGGIGLGLGYISPVSTLIKWFPDRPGMATGLAIMGFGGGALIGAPLEDALMKHFASASDIGIVQTFLVMGVLYFVVMMFGVFTIRVPAEGWKPDGYVPAAQTNALVTTHGVTATEAIKTPQFWLLWGVLFFNVTAGIGLLYSASPMIQDLFPGRVTPAAAAGFVGLLSLFNLAGRFLWSSLSDTIGRKSAYLIYFVLGFVLYILVPIAAHLGSIGLFIGSAALIISMYGGGFSTAPAYLRDLFGTLQVGAIHGRLLTAWSAAGIAGPLLFTTLSKYQESQHIAPTLSYNLPLHIMADLLVLGFICNLLVRPVAPVYYAETNSVNVLKEEAVHG
ncbi:MAG: L-lactate MFS transporter [Janthinobacterium lividum]